MTAHPQVERATYTIPEVCQRLGISAAAYYRLQRRGGGLPVVKIGGRTMIRRESLEAWLSAREGKQ